VVLRVENGRLLAETRGPDVPYRPSDLHVQFVARDGKKLVVLDKSVTFFIPERVSDPSVRAPGEQLWVEATIPKKGVPRPIRLGVKKGSGPIVPLDLK
jgi:hypothetical protein